MRRDTKTRKKSIRAMQMTREQQWWADQVVQITLGGKRALDAVIMQIGLLIAEMVMYIEREEIAWN